MVRTYTKAMLLTAATACVLLVAQPGMAQGGAPAAGAERAVRIEDQDSMAGVLKRLEGRMVKIRLTSGGDELSGKLQKVGKDLVHLSDLAGREFYDAIVRIDQVSAVSVQVRGR